MHRGINERTRSSGHGPMFQIDINDLGDLMRPKKAAKATRKVDQSTHEQLYTPFRPTILGPQNKEVFFIRTIGDGKEVASILKPLSRFGEVYTQFAQKCGLCRHCHTVDLRYNGKVIRPLETPSSLQLDQMVVHVLEATITGPKICVESEWASYGTGEDDAVSDSHGEKPDKKRRR